MLFAAGVEKVVVLYDGASMPAKKNEHQHRTGGSSSGSTAYGSGFDRRKNGQGEIARKIVESMSYLNHHFPESNLTCIVCPYEADHQASFMSGLAEGHPLRLDAVWSHDCDFLILPYIRLLLMYDISEATRGSGVVDLVVMDDWRGPRTDLELFSAEARMLASAMSGNDYSRWKDCSTCGIPGVAMSTVIKWGKLSEFNLVGMWSYAKTYMKDNKKWTEAQIAQCEALIQDSVWAQAHGIVHVFDEETGAVSGTRSLMPPASGLDLAHLVGPPPTVRSRLIMIMCSVLAHKPPMSTRVKRQKGYPPRVGQWHVALGRAFSR